MRVIFHFAAGLIFLSTLIPGDSAQGQILRVPSERPMGNTEAPLSAAAAERKVHTSDEPALHRIELGALTVVETDRLIQAASGTPMPIGIHRDIAGDLVDSEGREGLAWKESGNGSWTSTLSFRSRGAAGLRVALEVENLPEGVEILFRSAAGQSYPIEATDTTDGIFWSPVLEGETAWLEIWAPSSATAAQVSLSVPMLSHLVQTPVGSKHLQDLGRSGGCNRDLACSPRRLEIGASVAKYVFESGIFTAICTGQLLADTDPGTTRYLFLTAAHCVSTKPEARSMTFFWHFQRAECKGADPTSVQQTLRGARLRYTSKAPGPNGDTTDHTLVELKRPPADGVT